MPGHISEVAYSRGNTHDFIEFAVTVNTDVSSYSVLVYGSDGYVDETLSLGTSVARVAGKDVYLVDSNTTGFNGIGGSDAIAIIDDLGNVVQFISFGGTVTANDGAASGSTSTNIGTTTGNRSLQSDNGGTSYFVQDTPNAGTIPCFAPGTMIETPNGPRSVESLKPGNQVLTLDHGPRAILWTQSVKQKFTCDGIEDKPILIRAGALGPGRPKQDLVVSPQHRVLVGAFGQLPAAFDQEAFVPAKALTGLRRVRAMRGRETMTWVHFACARHEIVIANGCLTESLLLGPMVLNGLGNEDLGELAGIYGRWKSGASLNGPPARKCLKVSHVRGEIERNRPAHCNVELNRLEARERMTA